MEEQAKSSGAADDPRHHLKSQPILQVYAEEPSVLFVPVERVCYFDMEGLQRRNDFIDSAIDKFLLKYDSNGKHARINLKAFLGKVFYFQTGKPLESDTIKELAQLLHDYTGDLYITHPNVKTELKRTETKLEIVKVGMAEIIRDKDQEIGELKKQIKHLKDKTKSLQSEINSRKETLKHGREISTTADLQSRHALKTLQPTINQSAKHHRESNYDGQTDIGTKKSQEVKRHSFQNVVNPYKKQKLLVDDGLRKTNNYASTYFEDKKQHQYTCTNSNSSPLSRVATIPKEVSSASTATLSLSTESGTDLSHTPMTTKLFSGASSTENAMPLTSGGRCVSRSTKASAWSSQENNAFIRLMRVQLQSPDGQNLYDQGLFTKISLQLKDQYNISRGWRACKFQWARGLREESGLDERKRKNKDKLSTSLQ